MIPICIWTILRTPSLLGQVLGALVMLRYQADVKAWMDPHIHQFIAWVLS